MAQLGRGQPNRPVITRNGADAGAPPPDPTPGFLAVVAPGRATVAAANARIGLATKVWYSQAPAIVAAPTPGFVPVVPRPEALEAARRARVQGVRARVVRSVGGVAYTPLPAWPPTLLVRIAPGADLTANPATWTWVDITGRVRYDPGLRITQGRADETAQATPSRLVATLDNSDGSLSVRYSGGTWFGQIARGTPIQVLQDLGGSTVERFAGYLDELPLYRDLSGNDNTVTVTASGILRRLGQGSSPQGSAMRRVISSYIGGGLIAYWPLEDASGSTSLASAVPGQAAGSMQYDGTRYGLDLAADSAWTGSGALPKLTDAVGDGTLAFPVLDDGAVATRVMTWVIRIPAEPGDAVQLGAFYTTGSFWFWRLALTPGAPATAKLLAYDQVTGAEQLADAGHDVLLDGSNEPWGHRLFCKVVVTQTGSDIGWSWSITDIDVTDVLAQVSSSGTEVGATLGLVIGLELKTLIFAGIGTGLDGATVGHVALANDAGIGSGAVYSYPPDDPSLIIGAFDATTTPDATIGYDGEPADIRLVRVCVEAGVPVSVSRSPRSDWTDFMELVGPQGASTLMALVTEAADADGGTLAEYGHGLWYATRERRYNQTSALTLDMAAGDVAAVTPTDDDATARDLVTVTRSGGSSETATDEAGLGLYDEQVTLSLHADAQCLPQAQWRVHLGTSPDARWPVLRIQLHRSTSLADAWLTVRPGDRITLTGLPAIWQADDVDLVIEGWTETYTGHRWDVALSCSPARAWDVLSVADDAAAGTRLQRVDTSGSTLASSVSSSATSWSVASPGGVWITSAGYPADFPFDLVVGPEGGERVTVTAITGGSSPQTFTVTRSVNGVVAAHSAGEELTLWHPGVVAL